MLPPRGRFLKGENHKRWKGGVTINDKGYRRISSGEHRGKYEHRVVMEQLLENPISYMFTPRAGIPQGMNINHQDQNKVHNCVGNLMLLNASIHASISSSYSRYIRDHMAEYIAWLNRWE